jgi:hypothetical protein
MQGFFSTEFLNPYRIDKALLASKQFFTGRCIARISKPFQEFFHWQYWYVYFKTLSGRHWLSLPLTMISVVAENHNYDNAFKCLFQNPFGKSADDPALFESA